MGGAITAIRCANCDRELQEHERPCPSCGGQNRSYVVHGNVTITLSVSSKGNLTDETGFKRVEFNSRSKISGETRRRVEEYLLIDHRHPEMTRKCHRVKEANDDGQMVTVHEHEETFPVKRRPLKSRSRNEE
jgi:RNA polymerase subunit RPABC4/transcription elongation factor Spt4